MGAPIFSSPICISTPGRQCKGANVINNDAASILENPVDVEQTHRKSVAVGVSADVLCTSQDIPQSSAATTLERSLGDKHLVSATTTLTPQTQQHPGATLHRTLSDEHLASAKETLVQQNQRHSVATLERQQNTGTPPTMTGSLMTSNLLITPPVLAVEDPRRAYEAITDASELGIGAVLLQPDDNVHLASTPVGLHHHEHNVPTTECQVPQHTQHPTPIPQAHVPQSSHQPARVPQSYHHPASDVCTHDVPGWLPVRFAAQGADSGTKTSANFDQAYPDITCMEASCDHAQQNVDGFVIAATVQGTLIAIDVATGVRKWQQALLGAVFGDLTYIRVPTSSLLPLHLPQLRPNHASASNRFHPDSICIHSSSPMQTARLLGSTLVQDACSDIPARECYVHDLKPGKDISHQNTNLQEASNTGHIFIAVNCGSDSVYLLDSKSGSTVAIWKHESGQSSSPLHVCANWNVGNTGGHGELLGSIGCLLRMSNSGILQTLLLRARIVRNEGDEASRGGATTFEVSLTAGSPVNAPDGTFSGAVTVGHLAFFGCRDDAVYVCFQPGHLCDTLL